MDDEMAIENLQNVLGHLGSQFERANPVLLTGAGFSLAAKNISGEFLPSTFEVRKRLWSLCLGDEPFDEASSLQDLYQMAKSRHSGDLVAWLTSSLSVDPDSLPEQYLAFFSFPWHRIYTLNIDNLPIAAQQHYQLPREIKAVSATSETVYGRTKRPPADALEVIHLNGTLNDLPDNVTFSVTQYSERAVRDEPWYSQLIVDLLARPVVFVGTQLDEPPMWQHLERRQSRGGRSEQQLRPKSYLVTPKLSKARQACLSEFNIEWLPMTAQDFCAEILAPLRDKAAAGHKFLRDLSSPSFHGFTHLPEVAELSAEPIKPTEFLAGAEPTWSDIHSKRAVERDCDSEISHNVAGLMKAPGVRGIVVITGTAGTGKSTSLKRLALKLSSAGNRVGWVDRNMEIAPRLIKQFMTGSNPPAVLAIDDADLYGAELSPLIREACLLPHHPLVLLAIRAGRLDVNLNPAQLKNIPKKEFVIPGLTDQDIGGLIDVLDRENRLGILVKMSRVERIKSFQDQCGRQLLVAMIQATSGKSFQEKIVSELDQLEGEAQRIYSLVSVATAWRFSLNKNELLLAVGEVNNKVLNALQKLTARNIITLVGDQNYVARHRVIAEVVLWQLTESGRLSEILYGLASAAATQIDATTPMSARPRRLLQRVLNHDLLQKSIGETEAKRFYGSLEDLLRLDFNFWLHRGCLELETGNLNFAEVCLNYARGLNADDLNTNTEYANLLFHKAITHPSGSDSADYVKTADELLTANIAIRGAKDPHSYHVLGNNMLEWIRRGITAKSEKAKEIQRILKIVEDGSLKHPANEHLKNLHSTLKDEYLALALIK